MANVLVFLQAILLFQKKSNRIYWEIIALSLLQVAVASALNLGFIFGIFLMLYVITAFLALALFFVHRILHKGEPVTAGRKYVLRTDVMFTLTS